MPNLHRAIPEKNTQTLSSSPRADVWPSSLSPLNEETENYPREEAYFKTSVVRKFAQMWDCPRQMNKVELFCWLFLGRGNFNVGVYQFLFIFGAVQFLRSSLIFSSRIHIIIPLIKLKSSANIICIKYHFLSSEPLCFISGLADLMES